MVNNIILIDGGMGQELIHRSKVKPEGLWSARVMLDNYDLVVDLHRDFIKVVFPVPILPSKHTILLLIFGIIISDTIKSSSPIEYFSSIISILVIILLTV